MKKSEIIVGVISMVFILLVTSCNYPKQHPIYSLVWEKPTVLDTNYVANGLNNPNQGKHIKGYYTQYNLIIDTSDVCYFYNNGIRRHGGCCGYGNEFDTPELIQLNPDKMVAVPNEDLSAFLDVNLRKNSRGEIYLMVASPVDTVRQESYKIIAEYIKKRSKTSYERKHSKGRYIKKQANVYNVGIRLITEEEKNVLYCKKKNFQYNFEDYNWRTKFSNVEPRLSTQSVRFFAPHPATN